MEVIHILTGLTTILLIYLFHKYFIEIYNYWRKRGIPTVPGALPFLGHALKIFCFHKTIVSFCDDVYHKNKDQSMVGFFMFRRPNLFIRDPELVKTVLISGFSKFHANVASIDPKTDPLLAENPFFNSGEKWKEQRVRLSNALMSSKRLRILCQSIAKVCEKFTQHLRNSVTKSPNGIYEIDSKELGNRFTGEVVANAGFGTEGDFFINGTGRDSFRENVSGFLEPTFFNTIQQIFVFVFPLLNKLLNISFLPKKMDRFFRRVVHEMIKLRRQNNTRGNDFLQLMLDNRRDNEDLDEDAITASATSFFIDGYETSGITLGLFAYQLGENPDAQEKIREEVRMILDKHNGEINYESLGEMTYMDRALNESMRLWPALGFMGRICTERCKLIGNDGLEVIVEPGTEVMIPLRSLQLDPVYWNDPHVYDPDRFNDETRKERPKMAFFPFGEGPRICVGMRFAMMQIKGAIATILKDFVIEMSSKTKKPLELKRSPILTAIEGGLWIKIKSL